MLLDLLSASNYATYNIKVAEALGLNAAVYISELLAINEKAIRKSKIENGSFKIDRKYIQKRTTLTSVQQMQIDENLFEIGILNNAQTKDEINFNVSALMAIITKEGMNEDDVKKATSKICKISKQENKASQYKNLAISAIKTTNTELHKAYCDWIESVINKIGYIPKKAVQLAENLIDGRSEHNLDIALKILEIATINGWRDVTYAITKFNNEYAHKFKQVETPKIERNIQLSNEVF